MLQKFKAYIEEVDSEQINSTWIQLSNKFKDFWKNKIMDENYPTLSDAEIDEIVLILDKNAKGSTKDTPAVARAMIPQGVWRRLFNEIKSNKKLRLLLDKLFNETEVDSQISLINQIYKANEGQKNSLTGKSGNTINCMLFAYNPLKTVAVVSINDRKRIIDYYKLENDIDFDSDAQGKKMVYSNIALIEGFKKLGVHTTPRIVSQFLYDVLKEDWKSSEESEDIPESKEDSSISESTANFYMEKELENFLISNWDKTELDEKYELIEENGDMVSQQYKTDIGFIDILVKDKKTGQLVVIELKKGQTSDDTIGQLTRYMGWLEEHKTNGKPTKGIIIASSYDKKLYYALKKIKDVEVYSYQVDFKLREFKEE